MEAHHPPSEAESDSCATEEVNLTKESPSSSSSSAVVDSRGTASCRIRHQVQELAVSDQMTKSTALTMLMLFSELEALLKEEQHNHDLTQMKFLLETERSQAEIDRLVRKRFLETSQQQQH